MNNKIRLFRLWEMLLQESDAEHPLSTNQILDNLLQLGLKCDRKTLYDDIELLKAEGYEILSRMEKHSKVYYVSDRKFSPPELKILMDAVQAAKFVTESKTQELVDKIAALGGGHRAKLLKGNIVRFNTALPQIPVNPLDYPTRICYNKTNSISKAVTLHDFSEYSEVLSRAT